MAPPMSIKAAQIGLKSNEKMIQGRDGWESGGGKIWEELERRNGVEYNQNTLHTYEFPKIVIEILISLIHSFINKYYFINEILYL